MYVTGRIGFGRSKKKKNEMIERKKIGVMAIYGRDRHESKDGGVGAKIISFKFCFDKFIF